jgi:transmembrane sensor
MESTPDSAELQASIEASEWLIRLQEDLHDPAVQAEFHAWISATPANRSAWAETRAVARFALSLEPTSKAGRAAAEGTDGNRQAASRAPASPMGTIWPLRRWAAYAGALAVAACLALVAGPGLVIRLQSDMVTDVAESQQLELPDGSRVTLAAASAIAVSFSADERRVSLLQGEAFFEVRHDPERPFRVIAEDVTTSVVGTSFDVRRDSSGVAVAVQEGIVEVSSSAGSRKQAERLTPGQSIKWSWRGQSVRADVPPGLVATWRQGQLILHDQRLGDAVDQFRRYYRGTIVLAEPALAGKPITGAYNLGDPEEALRAMARVHGAKVRQITPWMIVISSI